MSNKKTINNRDSRLRKKMLEFASTVESFDAQDLHTWWFNHSPRTVPARNKLQSYLSRLDCLDKLGYRTKSGKGEIMKYKLKDDWYE